MEKLQTILFYLFKYSFWLIFCFLVVPILAFLLISLWQLNPFFVMPKIAAHEGDGLFTNRSYSYDFAHPQYEIKLPEFDLGKPFQAEYRFRNLSTFVGARCFLSLAIPSDKEDKIDFAAKTLIEVTDNFGDLHLSSEKKLRGGYEGPYSLSDRWSEFTELFSGCSFHPESEKEYIIRIKYEPDPTLLGSKGFYFVDCRKAK